MNCHRARQVLRPKNGLYLFALKMAVTSMTAPVASGWGVRRVGLAPTGRRRRLTAHTLSGRCRERLNVGDRPLSERFHGGPRVVFPSEYVPHLHIVGALQLDGPSGFAVELVLDQVVGAAGDLDGPARALGFHTARQIHGRAPEIVDELLAADDAGHHRAGVDANAERELVIAECPRRHGLAPVDRKLHESGRMVGTLPRHSPRAS